MPLFLRCSWVFSFPFSRCLGLSRCSVMKNVLYLRLLTPVQGRAKNGAAVATELVRHESRIGGAEKREDGRISRLNHRSNLLYEFVWYAELVLPPSSLARPSPRSERP